MITKFAAKREVKTANGKVYVKRPKIQRLITPIRLRRKKVIKVLYFIILINIIIYRKLKKKEEKKPKKA